MTEKEKMVAGLWYDANNDQELIDQRLVCQDLCFELNQLKPSDEKRNEIIEKFDEIVEEVTTFGIDTCFSNIDLKETEFIKPNFYTDKDFMMLKFCTIEERWGCSGKNWDGLKHKTELTYPEFIKLFEGGEGETSLQIALKALENIINPIGYMKSQLEEGDTLNGYAAVMIAEKPQFYQNIAKEALEKINSNQ